ncbi:MAG: type II secretion system F family protein [Bdellovibrionales bacterium]|jgi:tight adherence protein C|nr:type II secretion system F family protein [Bdellovibrionales bacterium]
MDGLLGSNVVVVIISALTAALSFVAFALPLLKRTEKKERYKEVIEKKRRTLFDQAREQLEHKNKGQNISPTQSMALFYRLQRLAGEASLSARNLTQQAGMRSPNAPIIYLVSRIVLPLLFVGLAMMFLSMTDREIKRGLVMLILMGMGLFGFFLPRILVKNTADKRQQEISLSFPDALDMMLICVQGGIGIEAAINRIAETVSEHSESLAEELGILSAELGMLNDRKGAFQGFAMRVGSGAARSFATAMLQAEQYGTSVSKAIRVLADESREMRMAAAEQKAAALPPKLTVPMILFFLPALFIVILGPAFIGSPK